MLVADLEGMGFAAVSVRANGKVGVGLTESGFKELYETDSELARHFLKVFPNRSIWEP
jgi:hypothetical protein